LRTTFAVVANAPEANVSEKLPVFAVMVPPLGGTAVVGVVQLTLGPGEGVGDEETVGVGDAVGGA
jgi:hypothetical protein